MPGQTDENQILCEFQQGKLELFYQKVYPAILLFAIHYLGEKKNFLAEDYVQDAVFDAWKRRDRFESLNALKAFLYTSVRNDTISLSRKEKAQKRYVEQLEQDVFYHTALVDQETQQLLYNAIQSLPGKERRVFEMSFIDGLKNTEIAEKLNVSDSTVKKQKAHALELLRKKLNPLLFSFFFSMI